MIKTLALGTALIIGFSVPSFAASLCDETQRTAMEASIKAMPEGPNKVSALEAWEASSVAFKAGNIDECDKQMVEAERRAGGKKTDGETQGETQTQ